MNNDDLDFKLIRKFGEGSFSCSFFPKFLPFSFINNGWIHIEKENNRWYIYWTSDKDYHQRLRGSAFCIIYDNGIDSVWEMNLIAWKVNSEDKRSSIIEFINEKLNLAYKKYE